VQVAKLLPGVQPGRSGGQFGANIIIRGSGPEDSKYYIDDVAMPVIFHTIGNLSIVPDQMIKELEFSTGGFGPRYGNATGGTIVIKTKNTIPDESKLEFKVNLPIYSSVYYETPLSESTSVSGSYRRSYIQFLLPVLLKQQEDIDIDVVPYFGDIHLQYLKVRDDGHSKLNIFNSHDGLQLAGQTGLSTEESGKSNVDILTSFTSLSYQMFRRLADRWTVTTTPSILAYTSDVEFFGNKVDQQHVAASWMTEFIKRFNSTDKLYLGFDYLRGKSKFNLFIPRPSRTDPFIDFEEAPKIKLDSKYQFYEASAWASFDKKVGNFLLSPGIRVFGFSQMKKNGYDPRLNMRYELSKGNLLKLAVGQYSKTPEGDELDGSFGNSDLDYEVSLHQIIGWERSWSDKWTSDIQVFKKNLKNAIRDDLETTLNNKGSERIAGAEVFLRRNATARLFGWLSYTHAKNETRKDDKSSYQTNTYDQTDILTLVANYKLNSTWNLGGRSTYHTGSPYTPVEDVVYNSNLDKYQRRTSNENENSARLPDSTKVSLYATKDFLMDEWKMQLKFGVEDYIIGDDAINVGYNYDYSKQDLTAGIPGIPYIEVRAQL
jgi:hypothetical protein